MEDLLSKQYFEDVSTQWDTMGDNFFGNAPRKRIYNEMSLRPGMHIADIGTGSGYLIEGLINESVELIAIDQSPAMLEVLKAKHPDQMNLTVHEGTSESLPCKDSSIDISMANMYLHHVERPSQAILEIARILKPGGLLLFTDLDAHNYDQLIEEQHDRWKGFDRQDIIAWMEEAGFTDIVVDSVGADCCTKSCAGDAIEISIFIAKGLKAGL